MQPEMTPIPPLHTLDRAVEVLSGVRSICRYLHIGPATFYRWTAHHRFPATLTPEGRWLTSTTLIDGWILARVEVQEPTSHTPIEPGGVV
jgi:hypothetical protein